MDIANRIGIQAVMIMPVALAMSDNIIVIMVEQKATTHIPVKI